ncbi:hypothetical protein [Listeria innocua]|uniref:hypothetical protein n=1 Tax=Listeria innocua TaxID=1642 RepID=UPI001A98B1F0|nr:hypothetical protein [Listeria innocua]UPH52081.1 hypothetical protein EWI69_04320 [Listeria innocua]UPH61683.1 hypothetical protein AB346_08140 [Listeria innocua]
MKISELFKLNKSQHELDFIDIDLDDELPLFLDDHIFSFKSDSWSEKCDLIVKDFFRKIHETVLLDRNEELYKLCSNLNEPNETCLGRSKGKPRGSFQSTEILIEIFEQLFKIKKRNQKQFQTIKTLSDMKFYIDGVGNDTISDIVTNLIRYQLIQYTNEQCVLNGIPTEKQISKPYWNEISSRWEKEESIDQLIIHGKRILLVPKNIVFSESNYTFTKERFVQHDMLEFLQEKELQVPNSPLIKHRVPKKNQDIGEAFVTKKSIREREHIDKKQNVLKFSSKYPAIMETFKNKQHFKSLKVAELYEIQEDSFSDDDYNNLLDAFIKTLKSIPRGKNYANDYHEFILGLLTFIFYPSLSHPKKETPIDNTRKRIDITYVNTADTGFFCNLKSEITSNYIYVECKNYSGKLSNPEFDQLAGRFNESSSKVGMLVCRKVDDFAYERAAGQYRRQNELLLIITDELLISMLNDMKLSENNNTTSFLAHEKRLYELKRNIEVERY